MKKRKIISMLLCASMLLTSFPGPVSAAETVATMQETSSSPMVLNEESTDADSQNEFTDGSDTKNTETDGFTSGADEGTADSDTVSQNSDFTPDEQEQSEVLADGNEVSAPEVDDGTALSATEMNTKVKYLDPHGGLCETNAMRSYQVESRPNGNVTWDGTQGAYYIVSGDVHIRDTITVQNGAVYLILTDNSTLTVDYGINVAEGCEFYIYAQSKGDNMGKLNITNSLYKPELIGSGNIHIVGGFVTVRTISKFTTGEKDKAFAVIQADTITDSSNSDNWSALVYRPSPDSGYDGRFYGISELADDLTIGASHTLTIPSGSSLTIPTGKKLTYTSSMTVENGAGVVNNGTLKAFTSYSEIINRGTLTNNNKMISGRLQNNSTGAFVNNASYEEKTENNNNYIKNEGTITNNGTLNHTTGPFSNSGILNNEATINNSAGTSNGNYWTNTGTVTNNGTINNLKSAEIINASGTFTNNNSFIISENAFFINKATVYNTKTITNKGTLANEKTLTNENYQQQDIL